MKALVAGLAMLVPAFAMAQTFQQDDEGSGFTASGSGGDGAVILMYHGLDSIFGFEAASFNVQIQYLANNGYTSISLDDLKSWVETGSPALPEKPVVITFDDNYITVYTVAYPALQTYGFFGYNYAHTNYVGVVTSYDHCDWAEIQEMEDAGVVYTESHTRTHTNLTTLSGASLTSELDGSKADIEANMLDKVCNHLAYPYGGYNATVVAATSSAGYETAVTTEAGVVTRSSNLLELPRYGVNPNNSGGGTTLSATFLSAVNQVGGGAVASWYVSASEPGYLGSGYHYAPAGNGSATATWSFTNVPAGNYEVSARWTAHANRATNAPYTISHAGGEITIPANQQQNGSQWVSLGVYAFDDYSQPMISLSNNADGYVIADGVQIVRLASCDWFLIH